VNIVRKGDDDDDDNKNKLVTVEAPGTFSKSFRQYLSHAPGKYDIKQLENIAVFGTAHILREVLMQKYDT
jgi:hypothetical protein